MRLYLVQHGDAVPEQLDPERPLSAPGRREVEAVARLLAGTGARVAHVVHSGKLWAKQTAELLATALAPGMVPDILPGLNPNDPVEPMARTIADWTSDVMLVGHLPFMAKLVARLVAGDERRPVAAFGPGTVVCLQQDEAGGWVIQWTGCRMMAVEEMNRAVLERPRALICCLLLLQSLCGCAAAQGVPGGSWIRAAPMPTSRSELAAAALDGRIYAAGGIAQWGTTAAFEAYDPATDRWEELPPLPEAAHHLAAAAMDDRIYVTGGYTDLLFSEITNRAQAYDPRARTWTRIADLPAPRAAHGVAAIEGKLYVVGGVGPDSKELWIQTVRLLGAGESTARQQMIAVERIR